MNNRNKFLKRGICVCAVSRKCQLIWFGLIDFHTDLIVAAGFLPVSHNFIVGLSDQSFFAVSAIVERGNGGEMNLFPFSWNLVIS